MVKITFLPDNAVVSVEPGTELLDAARQAGVSIQAPCGGKGACGKCIVKVLDGHIESDSQGLLSQELEADGYVLACKSKVIDSELTIEVPRQEGRSGGKFTDADEDVSLVRHELLPKKWNYEPLAVKWNIDVPEPQLEDGLSDLDRITRRLQLEWGKKKFIYPLDVIRNLPDVLRAEHGNVTVTMIREPEQYHVIHIEPGNTAVHHYGIAVDVGTTTIAVRLVYLPLAESVATENDYNDQITCGLDVISRINYAKRPERLEELRQRVLSSINKLIEKVCLVKSIEPYDICNAVISGNTTMIHLLLGIKPEFIRLEPYTPAILETPFLEAGELDININPNAWVYFSPNVGSYVGGDITAGILCTSLATESEAVSLFIDIGTNGELVVGNNEFMMTCACSAGPAFEGGGIEYGMRASLGAIEKVYIEPETGKCTYITVGDVKPVGICGSGMISLIADLFLSGWLNSAGKLNRDRDSDFIKKDGRNASYIIAPGMETGHGKDISINETDIDNLIRAKAAIYSACAMMLAQIGMTFDDLENIYIAGGFGRYLDLDKAIVLGLVPDLPREKFNYIGNSSLTGTYMVLVSQEYREKQLELAKRMTYLELSTDPSYMDQYTGALFLPHTDMDHFPNVKAKLSSGVR